MALFGSDPYVHPTLGRLERKRGAWVGKVLLAGADTVPLRMAGDRTAPDATSVATAEQLDAVLAVHRERIAAELLEHLAPYRDAVEAGEYEPPEFPVHTIREPDDVWPQVRITGIDIDGTRRDYAVEVQLVVPWDEEHTLGARFTGEHFVELCGSVLPMV